ncbi:unnamed protein product [Phytophthora lilii]|uniref:Unnamed protein product n=1 Tax=Phytophthora lilii TaxID=2077276 RepID=A0A9W6WEF2_9STRA|nr:unnamed protein product [Phytophthora lilii]
MHTEDLSPLIPSPKALVTAFMNADTDYTSTGVIIDLLRTISSRNPDEKEADLLQLLQKCADDDGYRNLVYNTNGVQFLASLVRSGQTFFTQVYALECLTWAIIDSKLSGNELNAIKDCIQDIPQGAFASVVRAFQTGTEHEKDEAAIRCACMTAISKYDDELREEGVVSSLVGLLRNGSDTLKLWATEALAHFTVTNDIMRSEVVKHEVIGPLVALLRVGTGGHKYQAMVPLGNLAQNHEAAEAIVQNNAIAPLVQILANGKELHKEAAAAALLKLSTNDSYCAEIAREGAINPLVKLLQYGNDGQKDAAAGTLRSLAAYNPHCIEIGREGAINPLVKLLQCGTDDQKRYTKPLDNRNVSTPNV